MDTQERIIELTDAIKELLLEKNKRYGDSAISPKRRFSKLDATQGILIRLDDRMNRIKSSDELRTNDISDLIGYLFLLLISKGVTSGEIKKLID